LEEEDEDEGKMIHMLKLRVRQDILSFERDFKETMKWYFKCYEHHWSSSIGKTLCNNAISTTVFWVELKVPQIIRRSNYKRCGSHLI